MILFRNVGFTFDGSDGTAKLLDQEFRTQNNHFKKDVQIFEAILETAHFCWSSCTKRKQMKRNQKYGSEETVSGSSRRRLEKEATRNYWKDRKLVAGAATKRRPWLTRTFHSLEQQFFLKFEQRNLEWELTLSTDNIRSQLMNKHPEFNYDLLILAIKLWKAILVELFNLGLYSVFIYHHFVHHIAIIIPLARWNS